MTLNISNTKDSIWGPLSNSFKEEPENLSLSHRVFLELFPKNKSVLLLKESLKKIPPRKLYQEFQKTKADAEVSVLKKAYIDGNEAKFSNPTFSTELLRTGNSRIQFNIGKPHIKQMYEACLTDIRRRKELQDKRSSEEKVVTDFEEKITNYINAERFLKNEMEQNGSNLEEYVKIKTMSELASKIPREQFIARDVAMTIQSKRNTAAHENPRTLIKLLRRDLPKIRETRLKQRRIGFFKTYLTVSGLINNDTGTFSEILEHLNGDDNQEIKEIMESGFSNGPISDELTRMEQTNEGQNRGLFVLKKIFQEKVSRFPSIETHLDRVEEMFRDRSTRIDDVTLKAMEKFWNDFNVQSLKDVEESAKQIVRFEEITVSQTVPVPQQQPSEVRVINIENENDPLGPRFQIQGGLTIDGRLFGSVSQFVYFSLMTLNIGSSDEAYRLIRSTEGANLDEKFKDDYQQTMIAQLREKFSPGRFGDLLKLSNPAQLIHEDPILGPDFVGNFLTNMRASITESDFIYNKDIPFLLSNDQFMRKYLKSRISFISNALSVLPKIVVLEGTLGAKTKRQKEKEERLEIKRRIDGLFPGLTSIKLNNDPFWIIDDDKWIKLFRDQKKRPLNEPMKKIKIPIEPMNFVMPVFADNASEVIIGETWKYVAGQFFFLLKEFTDSIQPKSVLVNIINSIKSEENQELWALIGVCQKLISLNIFPDSDADLVNTGIMVLLGYNKVDIAGPKEPPQEPLPIPEEVIAEAEEMGSKDEETIRRELGGWKDINLMNKIERNMRSLRNILLNPSTRQQRDLVKNSFATYFPEQAGVLLPAIDQVFQRLDTEGARLQNLDHIQAMIPGQERRSVSESRVEDALYAQWGLRRFNQPSKIQRINFVSDKISNTEARNILDFQPNQDMLTHVPRGRKERQLVTPQRQRERLARRPKINDLIEEDEEFIFETPERQAVVGDIENIEELMVGEEDNGSGEDLLDLDDLDFEGTSIPIGKINEMFVGRKTELEEYIRRGAEYIKEHLTPNSHLVLSAFFPDSM